jgi:hypothetical protein
VPAQVAEYSVSHLDAAASWRTLVAALGTLEQPQLTQALQMADASVSGMFQVDGVAGLLAGLGQQVIALRLPAPDDAADPQALAAGMNRYAICWHLADAALWQRVVDMLGQMGTAQGLPLQPRTLGAFNGYRFSGMGGDVPPMGLYVGGEHLVLTIGRGVADPVLSALNDPASVTETLADSQLIATARDGAFLARLIALMPSAEELRGCAGVATSHATVDGSGAHMEAVIEMPQVGE